MKVLAVGNLVEPKGFEYLIRASKILRERGFAVKCEIIGGKVVTEMNYYIDLHKLRKRLALEKEVAFLGKQPFYRVLEKYQDADIFVLPAVVASHGGRDITPNVMLEAMAMKLPVISTTSGAISEIVENEVSGILVSPRDEEAIAAAIVRLLTNESLREKLGNNARRRVEERFDISKNIREFVALFETGAGEVNAVCPPVNRVSQEGARA
jgi:glycosyltransferase involved in cell wall biosynthesis